jgi:hypothetical protein
MCPCSQNLPYCKQLRASDLILGANFSSRSLGWAQGFLGSIYIIINAYIEHMQLMWDLKCPNSPKLACTRPYPWYPAPTRGYTRDPRQGYYPSRYPRVYPWRSLVYLLDFAVAYLNAYICMIQAHNELRTWNISSLRCIFSITVEY